MRRRKSSLEKLPRQARLRLLTPANSAMPMPTMARVVGSGTGAVMTDGVKSTVSRKPAIEPNCWPDGVEKKLNTEPAVTAKLLKLKFKALPRPAKLVLLTAPEPSVVVPSSTVTSFDRVTGECAYQVLADTLIVPADEAVHRTDKGNPAPGLVLCKITSPAKKSALVYPVAAAPWLVTLPMMGVAESRLGPGPQKPLDSAVFNALLLPDGR